MLSRQFQRGDVCFPDLTEDEDQDEVLPLADKAEAQRLIRHNVSMLAEVADENEAAAMNPVLRLLPRMKQAGRACILVHYSGKTGTDFQAGSKPATTSEVSIGRHRLEGRAAGDEAVFALRWGNNRGAPSSATGNTEVQLEDSEGRRE